jgi:hypothetical protein
MVTSQEIQDILYEYYNEDYDTEDYPLVVTHQDFLDLSVESIELDRENGVILLHCGGRYTHE